MRPAQRRRRISAADRSVTGEFDLVGAEYDRLTNRSPGYADQLYSSARLLVGQLRRRPGPGDPPVRVADLGCGSGASTAALVRALTESGLPFTIDGVDGSESMLVAARAKSWPAGVTFRRLQAEDLAQDGDSQSEYDAVFAAYLVRNVPDRDAFLTSVVDRLAQGGVLVVHDYGVAGRPLDVAAWTALAWGVIIPFSTVVTRRPALFTYLWRSVLAFDSDERLRARLGEAGLTGVGQRPVPGWQRGMVRVTWGHR